MLADNLEAHRTVQVDDLLKAHRTVHLHLVPTYLDWLTQTEQWLSKIERDIDVRGMLTSGAGLKSKLMRHIRQYHNAPKTLKWKYFHPARRLTIEPTAQSIRSRHSRTRRDRSRYAARPVC